MRRTFSGLAVATILLAGLPVLAQTPDQSPYGTPVQPTPYPSPDQAQTAPSYAPPAPGPTYVPVPPAAAYAQPVQTVYAVREAHVRNGPGTQYAIIGKIPYGAAVQVTGGVPGNPHWVHLTTGGFVAASILSPTPVIVEHHHHEHEYLPPAANYPVGSCQPYSRVIEVGGVPQQTNGTACKQPDGTWKIVTNNGTTPVIVQQPPVVVQQPVPPAYIPGPTPYYR